MNFLYVLYLLLPSTILETLKSFTGLQTSPLKWIQDLRHMKTHLPPDDYKIFYFIVYTLAKYHMIFSNAFIPVRATWMLRHSFILPEGVPKDKVDEMNPFYTFGNISYSELIFSKYIEKDSKDDQKALTIQYKDYLPFMIRSFGFYCGFKHIDKEFITIVRNGWKVPRIADYFIYLFDMFYLKGALSNPKINEIDTSVLYFRPIVSKDEMEYVMIYLERLVQSVEEIFLNDSNISLLSLLTALKRKMASTAGTSPLAKSIETLLNNLLWSLLSLYNKSFNIENDILGFVDKQLMGTTPTLKMLINILFFNLSFFHVSKEADIQKLLKEKNTDQTAFLKKYIPNWISQFKSMLPEFKENLAGVNSYKTEIIELMKETRMDVYEQTLKTEVEKYAPYTTVPKVDPKTYNILIIGESGSGKSTLINNIFNLMTNMDIESTFSNRDFPLLFKTLDDTKTMKEMIRSKTLNIFANILQIESRTFQNYDKSVILNWLGNKDLLFSSEVPPEEFGTIDSLRKMIFSVFGNPNTAETQKQSASVTMFCNNYTLHCNEFVVNFIDTPGLSDTNGGLVDERNLDIIAKYLKSYKHIDYVLYTVNANTTRLKPNIQNYLKLLDFDNLITKVGDTVESRFAFCFTYVTQESIHNIKYVMNSILKHLYPNKDKQTLQNVKYYMFNNETIKTLKTRYFYKSTSFFTWVKKVNHTILSFFHTNGELDYNTFSNIWEFNAKQLSELFFTIINLKSAPLQPLSFDQGGPAMILSDNFIFACEQSIVYSFTKLLHMEDRAPSQLRPYVLDRVKRTLDGETLQVNSIIALRQLLPFASIYGYPTEFALTNQQRIDLYTFIYTKLSTKYPVIFKTYNIKVEEGYYKNKEAELANRVNELMQIKQEYSGKSKVKPEKAFKIDDDFIKYELTYQGVLFLQ